MCVCALCLCACMDVYIYISVALSLCVGMCVRIEGGGIFVVVYFFLCYILYLALPLKKYYTINI